MWFVGKKKDQALTWLSFGYDKSLNALDMQ
jgi:hypothetical protein